jgi:hypothetical protein
MLGSAVSVRRQLAALCFHHPSQSLQYTRNEMTTLLALHNAAADQFEAVVTMAT